ncbi:hypothetical protein M2272_005663 [Mycobacterium frederiksbergense]|uniref:LpqV protein n=1 Tax=Mycolicibacterium frederiksbergense TaxID=117567 RepID=A0ABT6L7V7_9MYCO|nr:lipoprotein LpqV [Mycolicibacterium frederiksbergense]MDH6198999.1 hypothetical protein [Mycolicibacterium frederiksbergense]
MRSYTWATPLTVTAALAVGLTGCGSESGKPGPAESTKPTPATTTVAAAPTLKPGEVGISPGGVTTAVGAASSSEESEYFQACHAAKVWMDEKGGDPKTLVEPYLATLQAPGAVPGPGTYNQAWADLPQERQAAVIVAAQGAANEWCG